MTTSTRHRVVLYNPKAPYFTMPLALLAIGSALDRSRYEVVVIDGRLESNAEARVVEATAGALCFAVSVLTGVPIRDALRMTQVVRRAHPTCRIVWGGWHPSLFPRETLAESGADAVVVGQGEDTFAEMLDRYAAGASVQGVPGCVSDESDGRGRITFVNPIRPVADIRRMPTHDYGLIDVGRYFALKGERQLDYITSQGCRFRCTFCADPTVYGRAWFGLEPARIGEELEGLYKQHRFTDVGFQDETFFTHTNRVAEIAEQFLTRGLAFSWMATMRADQGARLDERVLARCRAAGLRRVMIGLESGSQQMLDWMKKDIKLEQVFESAEKCRRHGVAVLFNLIVGFPGESADSVAATLNVAKRLRAYGPGFQVALFTYRPYPGTPITDDLEKQGHRLPRTLAQWAEFEDPQATSPWIDHPTRVLLDRFSFYQRIGWAQPSPWRAPLQAVARWRCRTDRYGFPIEKIVVERLRPSMAS